MNREELRTITCYKIKELAKGSVKNEILLDTNIGTELHISDIDGLTIIKFPFGNKFDIIDNKIIIYKK